MRSHYTREQHLCCGSMKYHFQWDPNKARSNQGKHGISFQSATQIFKDPAMMTVFDEAHSLDEAPWITLGQAASGQYLVVVHTFEEVEENRVEIRIISVRKATRQEIQQYEGGIRWSLSMIFPERSEESFTVRM
jgi:uncharacterized protein